ncbi:hypothetical protein ADIAL_1491 [Alkalibacterium sp. AK22]|uniref:hypothetical protein n=1 Tax=Alkalibacterium sp. AK22 TaxID=1229520 RepID=UPI0004509B37|nr:hypothetical protein [Alkalibacterium sp. AK22]EXJ23029.1 hypothetical protein ADIAL_1491 [Alkalibacterium sp. AK22]
MGLFDFLKGNKKEAGTPYSEADADPDNQAQAVQYETRLTAHELQADKERVQTIVEKMVDEDPFKHYYGGLSLKDVTPLTRRTFKYAEVTTMNVDFQPDGPHGVLVEVEGLPLGQLSGEKAEAIKAYTKKYVPTGFVYVSGGPYIEYSQEEEAGIEGHTPLGLDIFVQFS